MTEKTYRIGSGDITLVKDLPAHDPVKSPSHYLSPLPIPRIYMDEKTGAVHVEAIDVIKAWGFQANAWIFNQLKYRLRAGRKQDNAYLQDLKKVRYYLDEEIAEVEKALSPNGSASNGGN